jgi:hypothetical protein
MWGMLQEFGIRHLGLFLFEGGQLGIQFGQELGRFLGIVAGLVDGGDLLEDVLLGLLAFLEPLVVGLLESFVISLGSMEHEVGRMDPDRAR